MNETQIDIVGILRFSALLLTCHDDDVRVIPLSVTSFLARASPIKKAFNDFRDFDHTKILYAINL